MAKKTRPLLAKTETTFSAANPTIENIVVKVDQKSIIRGLNECSETFNEDSVPEYVRCSNPNCREGGYYLKAQVASMTSSKETERRRTVYCEGFEGSMRGKKRIEVTKCGQRAEIKISVKYRKAK